MSKHNRKQNRKAYSQDNVIRDIYDRNQVIDFCLDWHDRATKAYAVSDSITDLQAAINALETAENITGKPDRPMTSAQFNRVCNQIIAECHRLEVEKTLQIA